MKPFLSVVSCLTFTFYRALKIQNVFTLARREISSVDCRSITEAIKPQPSITAHGVSELISGLKILTEPAILRDI
jgi:hypothetical protein